MPIVCVYEQGEEGGKEGLENRERLVAPER